MIHGIGNFKKCPIGYSLFTPFRQKFLPSLRLKDSTDSFGEIISCEKLEAISQVIKMFSSETGTLKGQSGCLSPVSLKSLIY